VNRAILAVVVFSGAPALAHAQSASTPLLVEATVVSECRVNVPQSAGASTFATMPVAVTCSHHSATPHVQRPIAPRVERPIAPGGSDVRDALVIINF